MKAAWFRYLSKKMTFVFNENHSSFIQFLKSDHEGFSFLLYIGVPYSLWLMHNVHIFEHISLVLLFLPALGDNSRRIVGKFFLRALHSFGLFASKDVFIGLCWPWGRGPDYWQRQLSEKKKSIPPGYHKSDWLNFVPYIFIFVETIHLVNFWKKLEVTYIIDWDNCLLSFKWLILTQLRFDS